MHLAVILGAIAAMLIWSAHSTIGGQESRAQRRSLDCERSFLASDDAKALVARFGASAVATDEIYLGEGFYETGTVLFGDTPEWRVEILWHDAAAQTKPKFVRVRTQSSRWHTPEGLTPGLDLHAVERLNSKPFRMTGFGTDYEGTLLSWAHGRLGPSAGVPCSVGVRLRPDDSVEYKHWYRQVMGAREFSSGHPAMQYLNPRVYEMWLDFRQASKPGMQPGKPVRTGRRRNARRPASPGGTDVELRQGYWSRLRPHERYRGGRAESTELQRPLGSSQPQ